MRFPPVGPAYLRSLLRYVPVALLACTTTQRSETQKSAETKTPEAKAPDTVIAKPDTIGVRKDIDSLVGIWSLDSKEETYEYTITIWPDGTAEQRLLGQTAPGSWRRLENGKYSLEPGDCSACYLVLKNGRLEDWDRQGFVRGFKRIGNAADLRTSVPQKKPESTRSESKVPLTDSVRPIPGLSYSQLMRDLDTVFAMKPASKVRGVPRHMGRSKDRLAALEVMGSKDEIYSVTLISGIAKDAGLVTAANTLLVSALLARNVAPGTVEWVVDAIGDTSQEPRVMVRDGKRFKVTVTMGIVSVHVEPE